LTARSDYSGAQSDFFDRKSNEAIMATAKYVYWQDGDMWLGYLEEFPDYMTQGEDIDDLKENLKDIYLELTSGSLPIVRRVAELAVA
jgi:predicted RNase H-like HicB family nuclease